MIFSNSHKEILATMKAFLPVFLICSMMLTACPDPEATFNNFQNRASVIDHQIRDQQIVDMMVETSMTDMDVEPICDIKGTFYLGLYSSQFVIRTIAFLTDVETDYTNTEMPKITKLTLNPLSCADRSQIVGTPIVIEGSFPIGTDGKFEIPLGEVAVVGEANCQSGREIKADISLKAQIKEDCNIYCGTIGGNLIAPFVADLSTSAVFGATKVTGIEEVEAMSQPIHECP